MRALALYQESVALWRRLEFKEGIAQCLVGIGGVASAVRQAERAVQLLIAAETLLHSVGLSVAAWPELRADFDRYLAPTRAQLDDVTFAAAWTEGRALSLDQIVAEAMAMSEAVPAAAAIPGSLPATPLDDLAHELALATEIQNGLLPAALPQPAGWRVAAALLPARETAGDFYDCFLLPDGRLALVIADVAGKGLGAALYMTTDRALIRTLVPLGVTAPAAVLAGVNDRLLEETHAGLFITAFFRVSCLQAIVESNGAQRSASSCLVFADMQSGDQAAITCVACG